MTSYIHETEINPRIIDALFARVETGESFSLHDLRPIYEEMDRAAFEACTKVTWGEDSELKEYVNSEIPHHITRVIRALREAGAIEQDHTAPAGRVRWQRLGNDESQFRDARRRLSNIPAG